MKTPTFVVLGLLFCCVIGGSGAAIPGLSETKTSVPSTLPTIGGDYTGPLYPVTIAKKRGFIDYQGKVRIPAIFNAVLPFDEDGFAVVYHGEPQKDGDPF